MGVAFKVQMELGPKGVETILISHDFEVESLSL